MKEQLSVEQALSQAFAHLDAGRTESARKLARALEGRRPEPQALAYLQGLIALREGLGKKAAQYLTRALSRDPGAVPPMLAMARAQIQQNRLTEGVTAYRRLLSVAPDLAVAWRELGDLHIAHQEFAAAAMPLRRSARVWKALAPLRNNLGIAERAAGNLDRAAEEFRIAIILDPSAAKPYANLAGALRKLRHPGVPADYAVRIAPDDAACRIEYGQSLSDEAAVAQFAEAARLLWDQAEPHWLLAETLARLGRTEEAAAAYRQVLFLDPGDSLGAQLALAKLGQGVIPERASAAHVSALYDQYAGSFDRDLLGNLDYRGPQVIVEGLARAGITGPLDILDAGCGTGLAGLALKPLAGRLDGIDLSEKMAEQARARGIYDTVVVADLVSETARRDGFYDLVVAADVLIYLGDLAPVLAAAHGALRPNGHFAFTVERGEGEGYSLQPTGRFAHAEPYLHRLASEQGFSVLTLDPVTTRREQGEPVSGLLCLLSRP
jgi:predicted TPR repeat methyltransferase